MFTRTASAQNGVVTPEGRIFGAATLVNPPNCRDGVTIYAPLTACVPRSAFPAGTTDSPPIGFYMFANIHGQPSQQPNGVPNGANLGYRLASSTLGPNTGYALTTASLCGGLNHSDPFTANLPPYLRGRNTVLNLFSTDSAGRIVLLASYGYSVPACR